MAPPGTLPLPQTPKAYSGLQVMRALLPFVIMQIARSTPIGSVPEPSLTASKSALADEANGGWLANTRFRPSDLTLPSYLIITSASLGGCPSLEGAPSLSSGSKRTPPSPVTLCAFQRSSWTS